MLLKINPHSRIKNTSRMHGFTLLEIIVALAIFAIIATLSFTSLMQVQRAHEATEKQMDRFREIQIALRRLEQDLVYISPRTIRDNNGEEEPAFRSQRIEEHYFEFTRGGIDTTLSPSGSDMQRVAYYMKDGTLVRKIWHQLDRTQATPSETNPLLTKIKTARVRFLDEKNTPHEIWPPTNVSTGTLKEINLPTAIEIRLELEDWGDITRLLQIQDLRS